MTISPLLVYIIVLVGFVATNLILAYVASPHKKSVVKEMPYESGMDPIGDARQPFDVKFYVVAILFLVFDVELLFLYPWAVVYKQMLANPATRNLIFGSMVSFLGILFVGYIYALKKRAFDWKN